MRAMRTLEVLEDVAEERSDQDVRWGEQNHAPGYWLAILTEEVGEVAKEIADGRPAGAGLNYLAYRHELVQVAAVAVAAIESLDRGNV
jgi:NTP pyrophosphatase (non-canonical NTP hydrolase)